MKIHLSALLVILLVIPNVCAYNVDFTYTDLESNKQNLSVYEGEMMILDIMATWCVPCKEVNVELKKVLAADTIEILSISIDPGFDSLDVLQEYKLEQQISWTMGIDQDEVLQGLFNIKNIPAQVLLDGDGNILQTWLGVVPSTDILARINDIRTMSQFEKNMLVAYQKSKPFLPFIAFLVFILLIYTINILYKKYRLKKVNI